MCFVLCVHTHGSEKWFTLDRTAPGLSDTHKTKDPWPWTGCGNEKKSLHLSVLVFLVELVSSTGRHGFPLSWDLNISTCDFQVCLNRKRQAWRTYPHFCRLWLGSDTGWFFFFYTYQSSSGGLNSQLGYERTQLWSCPSRRGAKAKKVMVRNLVVPA